MGRDTDSLEGRQRWIVTSLERAEAELEEEGYSDALQEVRSALDMIDEEFDVGYEPVYSTDLRCECGNMDLVSTENPRDGPPDPDRWGNMRVTWICSEEDGGCGERHTILHASHGGTQLPEGLERASRLTGECY